jgi:DegV family protein with EDD domain
MQIVMDDTGDIPMDLVEKYNIRIIPINIMFGTDQFLSRVELNHAAFYEKTKTVTADNFPKTSQPTPFQFVELYKEIFATGETEILTVTVSEKLSGTYASVVQARKELEGQGTIHLFDSQAGAAAQGYIALEAARMAHEGADINTILPALEKLREAMSVVFTIDSLEYAVKGGRVSSMKSLMASLLNIKPILRLDDGLIVEAGRVRTRKRALDHIVDMIHQDMGNQPIKLVVIHANAPEDATILQEKARAKLNIAEELFTDISIPVAINLGPGALGLIAFPAE